MSFQKEPKGIQPGALTASAQKKAGKWKRILTGKVFDHWMSISAHYVSELLFTFIRMKTLQSEKNKEKPHR